MTKPLRHRDDHDDHDDRPTVTTSAGRVQGCRYPKDAHDDSGAGVAVFRGIPYAEPPVGRLRFAAPQPRRPWEHVLDATSFGPTPQRGESGITLIPEHAVAGEDTLSVNVWTPTLDGHAGLLLGPVADVTVVCFVVHSRCHDITRVASTCSCARPVPPVAPIPAL